VEDPEVYVYRDSNEPSGRPAAAATEPGAAEPDASYWYDLSGEDSAPVPDESRGPFEPLVSSSRPQSDPGPPAAPARPDENGDENSPRGRAGRLEQIKDLYLTAEAIGERNVDKHFDELLAHQRELISEYFKRSDAAGPGDGRTAPEQSRFGAQAPADPDPGLLDRPGAASRRPGAAGRHPDPDPPPEASVVADQPRVW
jgi:hypothetical protein